MNRWAVGIIMMVLIIAGIVYAIYQANDYDFNDAIKSYKIINKWEMPEELREISGIYWLNDNRIACIQDEDGIIFVYDLKSSRIVKKYKFAGPGDYEALTFLNGSFWAAESNGRLHKINNITGPEKDSEVVELDFEYRHNIEGLAATSDGKLLLSVKDRNLDNRGDYKGIYAFDPKTAELNYSPYLKINYNDPAFEVLKTNNPRLLIRPSDLSFNPESKELYVLDAEFQKILIMKGTGKIKEMHLLDPAEFTQPEGLCFSPSGRMFIANESLGGPANIIELKILKKK
ncbi:SdiA-regulated domain-containing protein [Christiangramia sabulilitoris]|uniref:SdiA-regulated family protein n=1 Tax=Christiangramia sabulilitoris TaxID=2583991 RepID=A0A550I6D4_9FLAO|nr:SdiA-regulated domain-containing protein [Christiangramia sabulilitoris]TRO66529.1 hypothetical protein FGM01_01210 [Christiangramia sabulilitoris]